MRLHPSIPYPPSLTIAQLVARQHLPPLPPRLDYRLPRLVLPHLHRLKPRPHLRRTPPPRALPSQLRPLHRRALRPESTTRSGGCDVRQHRAGDYRAGVQGGDDGCGIDLHVDLSAGVLYICYSGDLWMGKSRVGDGCTEGGSG